jgi:hypothetical protein
VHLDGGGGNPVSKFVVQGYEILNEEEVLPVMVRCAVCGSCAVMGESGYATDLAKVADWAAGHECPRNQSVT